MTVTKSVPLLTQHAPVSGLIYHEPRKIASNNSIRVDVSYDTSQCSKAFLEKCASGHKQKVMVQTPMISRTMPKEWINKDQQGNEVKKWEVQLSLRGYDNPDSDVYQFHNWVKEFEALTKNTAITNSKQWFKKDLDAGLIEAYFTSCIKPSSDPKYAPTIKINVPFRYGKFECDVYGPGGASDPLTFMEYYELSKACEVQCIIEWNDLWFMPKSFGATPVLRAIQIFPQDKLTGYAFQSIGVDPTPAPPQEAAVEETEKRSHDESPETGASDERKSKAPRSDDA